MATNDELMQRNLPKWPQMLVTGTTLPVEQALEIIRRTDSFFIWGGGNDHAFNDQAKAFVRQPEAPFRSSPEWKNRSEEEWSEAFRKFFNEEIPAWKGKWGFINTQYVINSWISCAYIGGPHGWCHPDGTIGYSNNVGKWPSVKEVFEEWKMLAEAFPFIEVEATLMDREYCEEDPQPVVSFLIRNGAVMLVDPAERNLHEEFGRTIPHSSDPIETMLKSLFDVRGEHAISLEQIKRWGEEIWKGEKDV